MIPVLAVLAKNGRNVITQMFHKLHKYKGILVFFCIISFLNGVIFWQVFLQNKIPLSANLLVSLFSPWKQEKFSGWEVGIPNKPSGKDDLWIFYPQRTFSTTVLKNKEIPLWNPYSFSGNYHLGLSETAIFYPFNLLFLFFPQIDVWVLLIIIEPIITGVGMYLFLKTIVSQEKSAIFGALAFAFSGVIITRAIDGLSVGHTLIWMPYVFWGVESFLQTKKIRFLWVILISLCFSLLAGWFQFTFYILFFSLLYALFEISFEKKKDTKRNLFIVIPFLLFPLLTLFHTIPALEALADSPRLALEGRLFSYQHLMPFIHIATIIFPDFWGNPAVYNFYGPSDYKESILFVGVIPLFFSLLLISRHKTKKELFFILAIIIAFLLGIDNLFSKALLLLHLPIYSSFIPSRIFVVAIFSFCVLASFGFDFVLIEDKEKVWRKIKKVFLYLWLAVVLFVIFVGYKIVIDPGILSRVDNFGLNTNVSAIQIRSTIVSVGIFILLTIICVFFKNKYKRNIFFGCVIAVFFLQSYIFAQKYIPFSQRQFLYPEHPVFKYLKEHQGLDRFMSIGLGHIAPSLPLQFGLYSPEGIGSMYIRRYGEFVRYMQYGDFGIPNKIAFDMEISPKDVFTPLNKRFYNFVSLTSIKYIVVDKKSMEELKIIPDKDNFVLVWENEKWQIYEYKKTMPRFFVTSDYKIITNKEKILQTLFSNEFNPAKVILEENPGFAPKEYLGNVKVFNYSPNKITMQVESDNNALIYFSDTYTKAFKAFIDGKEGRILRANYTFRAIPVEKGKHIVVVRYDTTGVSAGFIIAGFVLTSFGIMTLIVSRKKI
ncbi:MAG: YfhO family protein [Candidatus Levyibacteriota bacterium]|nr:MAG: YfhO family protein [Candidatus Levybacteria bacterium]